MVTFLYNLPFITSTNLLESNLHHDEYHFATEKDWDDIKFGVDNKVDFYAVSFVKDAQVIHELKSYLKSKHK